MLTLPDIQYTRKPRDLKLREDILATESHKLQTLKPQSATTSTSKALETLKP